MRRAYHGQFMHIARILVISLDSSDTGSPNGQESGLNSPGLSTPTTEHAKHHKRLELTELTDQTNLLPFRKILIVFLGLSVCIVVSTLDQTLVATALPSISSAFHAGTLSSLPSFLSYLKMCKST